MARTPPTWEQPPEVPAPYTITQGPNGRTITYAPAVEEEPPDWWLAARAARNPAPVVTAAPAPAPTIAESLATIATPAAVTPDELIPGTQAWYDTHPFDEARFQKRQGASFDVSE